MTQAQILYDDHHLIAVNKSEGIATIPERRPGEPSLIKDLSAELNQRLYIVHRIDKDVSGVVMFAKTPEAHRVLCLQFERGTVRKTYRGLAWGQIETDSGVINQPIRQFGSGRMGIDVQRGKRSVTEFTVLERLPRATLVKIQTRTGRRHQIRVHFYSLGHPLVGDLRYGDKAQQQQFPRLMLHASEIQAQLPDGAPVILSAPLPESFTQVLEMERPR